MRLQRNKKINTIAVHTQTCTHSPANRSCESALEMWQLRQTLDMQASALWLISAPQLCRAIAAWLALQKKALDFFYFSLFLPLFINELFFSFCQLLLDSLLLVNLEN